MDHFVELTSICTNENAPQNFSDVCEILINKPQVMNKRLCGKRILLRQKYISSSPFTSDKLEKWIRRAKTNYEQLLTETGENFISALDCRTDEVSPPDSKKVKLTKPTGKL